MRLAPNRARPKCRSVKLSPQSYSKFSNPPNLLLLFREPALAHTLALLENFEDAPKTGESGNGQEGLPEEVADHYRTKTGHESANEEGPPTFYAKIVFTFDYQGVAYTNNNKATEPKEKTRKIIFAQKFKHST